MGKNPLRSLMFFISLVFLLIFQKLNIKDVRGIGKVFFQVNVFVQRDIS